DVADRRAKEDREQQARRAEDEIEELAPQWAIDMRAEFDSDAAQHQQPEDDHQRQIEAAEARGIKKRKSEIERAAGGDQPDLVPIPHRSDAAQNQPAFRFVLGDQKMNDPGA